jgi:hypothetical protein
MDRATISNHLEQARRHVAEAERHIARQREMVAQLRHDGHDVSESEKLLDLFEQLYVMHVADRDRLEKELDEASE